MAFRKHARVPLSLANALDYSRRGSHFETVNALTLGEAQRSLSLLAQRALRGEPVLIRVDGYDELLSLQSVPPELPPNYLSACYGPEEIAEEEYLVGFAPSSTAT